ncbi:MAG: hypothetical protein HY862_12460 [Chloroflexi bacterium]|nr:hypothetical protein [Chloroflexota bacterium]
MMRLQALTENTSLFEIVDHPTTPFLFTEHRTSLISISREIENCAMETQTPARVFAGFQKLSFFLPHIERYREIAQNAESVWVFGVPDITPPDITGIEYALLVPDHLLVQEWFLVVESPEYFSALVAKDLSGLDIPHSERLFRGIWTFDAELVNQMQRQLSHLLGLSPVSYASQERDYGSQMRHVSRIAKDLIQTLEKRNTQLIEAQQLHEQLLRMLVHDLRNPLSGIMGYVDLIERAVQRGSDPSEILEFVERARMGNAQLNILIENILDLNRLQVGAFPVKKEVITLGPLFEAIQHQFLGMAQLQDNTLQIVLVSPDLTVAADRNILTRVLSNLLSNAIRHTRQGEVRLEAKRDPRRGCTLIIVADTGEGISPTELGRIFDPYYQGENRRTKGAAGLGLTFCKQAVEAQGGVIWVESKIGKGSAFHVRLPRV